MMHWLVQRSQLTPSRQAIIWADQTWTFFDLDRAARTMARGFIERGVQPGDVVALLAPASPQTVAAIHAIGYVGAVLLPLNYRLAAPELRFQLRDGHPRMLLYDDPWSDRVEELDAGEMARVGLSELQGRASSVVALKHLVPFAMGADQGIIYTSGTSGTPKAVRLTYHNHWWSATASALNLGFDPSDAWLSCLPFFHVSGLSIVYKSVLYGIPMVLHERFQAGLINRSIVQHRVTLISLVSVMLQALLDDLGTGPGFPALRAVLLGGGPIASSLLERAHERGISICQTYGLTETASQIVTLAPDQVGDKRGSAGQPLFGAEIKIVEAPSKPRSLAAGQIGEIAVRGPMVSPGYLGHAARGEDWLYTGDMGYLDPDGFLYVLDRRTDLIISGGENVYPAEVEAALVAHPAVAEAGVVGRPDTRWGQVPVAFVRLHPHSTMGADALLPFLQGRLAAYKIPREIHVVAELPRTASGKLWRRKLAGWVPPDEH